MPIGTGCVAEPAGSGGSTGLERLLARVPAAARLVVPACPGNAGPVGLPARSAQCIRLIRRRVLLSRASHSLTREERVRYKSFDFSWSAGGAVAGRGRHVQGGVAVEEPGRLKHEAAAGDRHDGPV